MPGGVSTRLNYVVRADFDLTKAMGDRRVDIVFSQAAFEHFEDVDATVAGMTAVCRPGAVCISQIDLKTHSRWIRDKDPNNIYRYHPSIYRLFRFRGSPNRLRPRDYVRTFERHGWTGVTIVPLAKLEKADWSHLTRAFKDGANQMELTSIMLCARKA